MARILVVDDDEPQRELMRLHLDTAGHEGESADGALAALASIVRNPPDLVVADVSMPGMDGYAMLAAIRANAATAKLPVLFLTALDPGEVVSKAFSLGVNEVLAKPLRRDSFLAAVQRSLAAAADGQSRGTGADAAGMTTTLHMGDLFARAETPDSGEHRVNVEATALFADIRNFATFAERLSAAETAELLDTFMSSVIGYIHEHRGWVVKILGDGIFAVFQQDPTADEHHAGRALKAAFKIVLTSVRFKSWTANRFPNRNLPEFAVGVGVHTGQMLLCQLATESGIEHTAIGDTVNIASRLEGQTKELGWSIVASDATIEAAGPRYVVGERASVQVKGRDAAVGAGEMIGISPREGSTAANWKVYKEFVTAVTENTSVLRRFKDLRAQGR